MTKEEVDMELLKQLEIKATLFWRMAQDAKEQQTKQRLLQQHREAFTKYRQHRDWLKIMGVKL